MRNILTAKKFKGYRGALLSKSELEDQLANGCAWCEVEFIDYKDRYAWLAPGQPVCAKCLDGTHESSETQITRVSVH